MGEIRTGMQHDTCPDGEPIQGAWRVTRAVWLVGRDEVGSAPTFAPGWRTGFACADTPLPLSPPLIAKNTKAALGTVADNA